MLIHLHRGDYVAADKCVRESYRYVLSRSVISVIRGLLERQGSALWLYLTFTRVTLELSVIT